MRLCLADTVITAVIRRLATVLLQEESRQEICEEAMDEIAGLKAAVGEQSGQMAGMNCLN